MMDKDIPDGIISVSDPDIPDLHHISQLHGQIMSAYP